MEVETKSRIWMEIAKARREGYIVSVQLKGDREDKEPNWWPIEATLKEQKKINDAQAISSPPNTQAVEEAEKAAEKTASDLLRKLFDGLDKNRFITAELKKAENLQGDECLACGEIRIQSSESGLR